MFCFIAHLVGMFQRQLISFLFSSIKKMNKKLCRSNIEISSMPFHRESSIAIAVVVKNLGSTQCKIKNQLAAFGYSLQESDSLVIAQQKKFHQKITKHNPHCSIIPQFGLF